MPFVVPSLSDPIRLLTRERPRLLALLFAVPVLQLACGESAPKNGGGGSSGGSVSSGGTALGGAGDSGGSLVNSGGTGGAVVPAPPLCGEAENAFGGVPRAVPGTIEAEDFDPLGYSDATTGNEGTAYRTDVDADIKAVDGGYALGWMMAGEWLEYTVEVATAGDYKLTLLGGSVEAARSVSLSSCGTSIAAAVTIPQVGSWGEFEAVSTTVHLDAGRQVLRVTVGASDYLDLDKLTFELESADGTGGAGSGGANTGGSGGSSETCPLPSSFSWTSSQPLAQPSGGGAALKDFSVTKYNGKYLVYATKVVNGYKGFTSTFTSFSEWSAAPQTLLGDGGVAPTIFYFEPKKTWVLVDQWGACPFLYRTSTTPDDPSSWTSRQCMMDGSAHPGSGGTGPIDQTVICDATNCYLFYADDNGAIYRGSMPIGSFPGKFTGIKQIMKETTATIFEGVQVYSIKGSSKYLMMIENNGTRAFRAWTADSLDGAWTAMPNASSTATPFAGENNVTWPGGKWTKDISHGDIVREDPSEKMVIDPCNLQLLYQGRDPMVSTDYDLLPYRPGLLTLVK